MELIGDKSFKLTDTFWNISLTKLKDLISFQQLVYLSKTKLQLCNRTVIPAEGQTSGYVMCSHLVFSFPKWYHGRYSNVLRLELS